MAGTKLDIKYQHNRKVIPVGETKEGEWFIHVGKLHMRVRIYGAQESPKNVSVIDIASGGVAWMTRQQVVEIIPKVELFVDATKPGF